MIIKKPYDDETNKINPDKVRKMCYEDYIPKSLGIERVSSNDAFLDKLWNDLQSEDDWLIDNINEDSSTKQVV